MMSTTAPPITPNDLHALSTFDLAFNLATGLYDEKLKFEVLRIIKSREDEPSTDVSEKKLTVIGTSKPLKKKPYLAGSKAEKIAKLLDKGFTAKEVAEELLKKKIVAYPGEIYRIKNQLEESKSQ